MNNIGIFGGFILVLIIGWLPVVLLLLLLSALAAVLTHSVNPRSGSRRVWLSRYFAVAAIAFTPCQIGFFQLALYAANPNEMSWIMTIIYSALGVVVFTGLSRICRRNLSRTARE
ncbi:MAG: hypothetical protein V7K27_21830 [Nostoc sp.]|jgi:hypothetical protein|uniref:hypothetical protein n=1 Tax=Nostoc sp. TaxID=1180 RepID=UPI002FF634B9